MTEPRYAVHWHVTWMQEMSNAIASNGVYDKVVMTFTEYDVAEEFVKMRAKLEKRSLLDFEISGPHYIKVPPGGGVHGRSL